MVKEISFSTGDFVVYPTHGVGKVLSITKDTVAGQELELIAVRFDKDRMTLRVPMTKAKKSKKKFMNLKIYIKIYFINSIKVIAENSFLLEKKKIKII